MIKYKKNLQYQPKICKSKHYIGTTSHIGRQIKVPREKSNFKNIGSEIWHRIFGNGQSVTALGMVMARGSDCATARMLPRLLPAMATRLRRLHAHQCLPTNQLTILLLLLILLLIQVTH